jgi:hypothetical protein
MREAVNIHCMTASVRVVVQPGAEGRAMSSNQGKRLLGEYELGPRYKHTGNLGRIYRARRVTTGAPALVVECTGRQAEDAPLADWQVLVTSSASSSFLALDVVRAPDSAAPLDAAEELVFMLDDVQNAVAATISRPETLPHLRGPARPPVAEVAPLPVRWPALSAGLTAAAALAALALGSAVRPVEHERHLVAEAVSDIDDAGWGGAGEFVTGHVLTGTGGSEPMVLARAMPRKPFSTQKQPPCDKQLEVELFGGCWVPHKTPAPCPDRLYEFDSGCYLPAAKLVSPRTAAFRQPLAFDRE